MTGTDLERTEGPVLVGEVDIRESANRGHPTALFTASPQAPHGQYRVYAAPPAHAGLVTADQLKEIEFSNQDFCPVCSGWDVDKGRGCTPRAHTKSCWLEAALRGAQGG